MNDHECPQCGEVLTLEYDTVGYQEAEQTELTAVYCKNCGYDYQDEIAEVQKI